MVEEGDYISPHCHHQNDSCIKMGSDVSHFNVSLIVRDKVTRQYTLRALLSGTFLQRNDVVNRCLEFEDSIVDTSFEEKGEPTRIRTEVPLLTSLHFESCCPLRFCRRFGPKLASHYKPVKK